MGEFSQWYDPGDGHSGVSLGRKYLREDYGTREKYFKMICDEFQVQPGLDLFADEVNHCCERYFDVQMDGMVQDWPGPEMVLWSNPPWSLWPQVAIKIGCTPFRVVCIAPGWSSDWLRLLLSLAVQKIYFEVGCRFFKVDNKTCKGIRWPLWALMVHSAADVVLADSWQPGQLGLDHCLVVPSWTLSRNERRRIRRLTRRSRS